MADCLDALDEWQAEKFYVSGGFQDLPQHYKLIYFKRQLREKISSVRP